MKNLRELNEEIAAKSKALHEIFTEAGPDMDMDKVNRLEGDSRQKVAEIARRNEELKKLSDERAPLLAVEEAKTANDERQRYFGQAATGLPATTKGAADPDRVLKTLEQRISESAGMKAYREGGMKAALEKPLLELTPAEFKTLITLTTISPQNTRLPNIVEMALEERTVADLLLESSMDRGTLEYYEETTVTNNAATVAEGGTKAESALAYTLRTEVARKIAHWIPATDESLSDVPALEGMIKGRLVYGVKRQEETQILTGSGVAPQLTGLLNRSGIQTQAKGADPVFDAIYKGMTKVRNTGFAEPTAIVMHPNDFQDMVLTRTADGLYIMGNPGGREADLRVWGLPVRVTTAETENTALLISRPYAQVFRRTGITIQMSTEHSTYFVENKVAILAEERIALACYRAAAFCTVTGI